MDYQFPANKQYRILWLYGQQGGLCYYCKRPFINDLGHVLPYDTDHKTPTSRGGKDNDENVCMSCVPCNRAKGNMNEEEFKPVSDRLAMGTITHQDAAEYATYVRLRRKFDPDPMEMVETPLPASPDPLPAPLEAVETTEETPQF